MAGQWRQPRHKDELVCVTLEGDDQLSDWSDLELNMKMKVATVGGLADNIRMSGVPESMKRGI